MFRRNLVLDILEKEENKMMPPHRATGSIVIMNLLRCMYVYKTKF